MSVCAWKTTGLTHEAGRCNIMDSSWSHNHDHVITLSVSALHISLCCIKCSTIALILLFRTMTYWDVNLHNVSWLGQRPNQPASPSNQWVSFPTMRRTKKAIGLRMLKLCVQPGNPSLRGFNTFPFKIQICESVSRAGRPVFWTAQCPVCGVQFNVIGLLYFP